MSTMKIHKYLIPTAAFLLMPTIAFAHPGHAEVSGFATGALHPLTGMDHLLAMLAAGVLAARLGGKARWALPAAFLLLMAVGGAVGVAGAQISFIEIGIALSVIVLGGLIALDVKMPVAVATVGTGFFALFHGYAHGVEMPLNASGFGYAAGFLSTTSILLATGAALSILAVSAGHRFGSTVVRTVGGLASTVGVGFLVSALAG